MARLFCVSRGGAQVFTGKIRWSAVERCLRGCKDVSGGRSAMAVGLAFLPDPRSFHVHVMLAFGSGVLGLSFVEIVRETVIQGLWTRG